MKVSEGSLASSRETKRQEGKEQRWVQTHRKDVSHKHGQERREEEFRADDEGEGGEAEAAKRKEKGLV